MRHVLLFCSAASFLLTGCPASLSHLQGRTDAAVSPPAPAAEEAPAQQALPYSISARDRGVFTEFTIRNDGPSPLPVRPQEIAMLIPETREQVHYDARSVVIDLPQDCMVAPGQSVTGRVRYLDHSQVTGNRLVFNPGGDTRGRAAVFCVIRGQRG